MCGWYIDLYVFNTKQRNTFVKVGDNFDQLRLDIVIISTISFKVK